MVGRRTLMHGTGASVLAAMVGLPRSSALAQYALAAPSMIVHRGYPLNAEPRGDLLRASFTTQQSDFYIRAHGTIPQIQAQGYKLRIGGQGLRNQELSLEEIQSRFPQRRITAVLQCAGNRRADMGLLKHVSGDAWQAGAISNAEWSGVSLGDVLRAAGVQEGSDRHVAFDAHDEIEEEGERFRYGVSIPLAKALAAETLLAFTMNGEPLTPQHGFPLRVVVPGYAGVRSPKWLAAITVQDKPSANRIQAKEYLLLPPEMTKLTEDLSKGIVINDMPLNSAILVPATGARLPAGAASLKGYAIATGQPIARVEVSADGGREWTKAEIEHHPDTPWSWTFWSASLNLSRGNHELVVRAVDGAGKAQPATAEEIWNFPGYLCTAWHRVPVVVD